MVFNLYTDLELLAKYIHEEALRRAEQRRLVWHAERTRRLARRGDRSAEAPRVRLMARVAHRAGTVLVALGTRLQAAGGEPCAATPALETGCARQV